MSSSRHTGYIRTDHRAFHAAQVTVNAHAPAGFVVVDQIRADLFILRVELPHIHDQIRTTGKPGSGRITTFTAFSSAPTTE